MNTNQTKFFILPNNEDYQLLQKNIKLEDAIRQVLNFATEDMLCAADLFFKIGDIHSFTDELKGLNAESLAYKYKR